MADPRIHDAALGVLRRVFGYPAFRGPQEDIIGHVAAGGDALVLMPTGGGKSLCYQIPALLRAQSGQGMGVVISPLIALMQDQVAALDEVGVRAAFLNSSLTAGEAREIEQRARQGDLDLLYIAPERLMTERCLALLTACKVGLFAIDEAHCVAQWGHDFRPEYIQLSILHERFPEVPRIALTATADQDTRAEIMTRLQLDEARVFISSFDRPNIRYRIVEKNNGRAQLLHFLRAEHAGEAGIVYCLSRRKVEETAAFLSAEGIPSLPYHAGMDAGERQRNQTRFVREDALVMVATIAFGMGIDKPDVRFVAHLDLPKSIEAYYQETGRAGRDGDPADAWMAYGLQDVVQQRRMIEESEADTTFKRMASTRLDAMLGLCETAHCRRVRLLEYFGQASGPCGNCDNCLDPPRTFDGTVEVQKLLSCIYRTGQRFGAMHVIEVLRGGNGEKVRQWGHDQLSTFGIGADHNDQYWRGVLRQCVALGMVEVDHDAYGALKLTGAARAVLKGEQQVDLREERKTVRGAKGAKAGKSGRGPRVPDDEAPLDAAALDLFERLRTWRSETAKAHNVPAYVIFHDGTLREIARRRPADLDVLVGVPGIGAKKLAAYGEEIVALCA